MSRRESSLERESRSDPVLELPGLDLPGRQIFHPPLFQPHWWPVAHLRRFLGDTLFDARHHAPVARRCRLADRIDEFGLVSFVGHDGHFCGDAKGLPLSTSAAILTFLSVLPRVRHRNIKFKSRTRKQ